MSDFTATIQLRADTAANWTSSNPILKSNELGIETDSFTTSGGVRLYKCKLGNETTAWNSLPYANIGQFFAGGGSASVAWGGITGTISDQTDLQALLDGKLSKSSNLSDLSSVTTARSNIGIGSGYVLVTHGGTNFTTPSDITTNTKFKITMTGGGGGGGGINTSGSKGSGGGGAATGVIWISGLTPSTNYSCVIGTGGNGGAAPGNGTDGTDTTLTIGATTYTAGGGKFGSGAVGNLGGLGGTLSVSPSGSFTFGASGQRGSDSPANSASSTDGAGGDSGLGLGTGGAPGRNGANGRIGDGYGSGGSGGHGAGATGGAGANGVIYAEYWN